jgi:hypothetical protein
MDQSALVERYEANLEGNEENPSEPRAAMEEEEDELLTGS